MKQIFTKCPICGSEKVFNVTDAQWNMYNSREYHIQDIFPELSPADRERMITGICGKCFDDMFKNEYE